MEEPTTSTKRRIAAVLLSLVQPGFGQIYAGRVRRGAITCTAYLAAAMLLFGGVIGQSFAAALVAVSLLVTIRVAVAVDTGIVARSIITANQLWRRWYAILAFAVLFQLGLGAVLPFVQRLKSYHIPSTAMEPTLIVGDHLVAALDAYDTTLPGRNDIAIFTSPEDPAVDLIKRVVALPGDTVELRDKVLHVNGQRTEEPWAAHKDPRLGTAEGASPMIARRDQMPPLTVPPGHVFALGDNRDFSYDSRFYGPVPLENIKGKALYVYWSTLGGRMGRSLSPRVDL